MKNVTCAQQNADYKNKRIKERKADIRQGRISTDLARFSEQQRFAIDFQRTKMLANYEKFNYALKREAVEEVAERKIENGPETTEIYIFCFLTAFNGREMFRSFKFFIIFKVYIYSRKITYKNHFK